MLPLPILEDPLEQGQATHSGILAWRIPWTEEPGELLSLRRQKSWILSKKGDNNRVLSMLNEALGAKPLVRHLVHLRMLAVIMRKVL